MRSAIIDGDVRLLMAAAVPGDLLIKVGDRTRVGEIVKPCGEMDGFHVIPWDASGREVWGCSLRLVKMNPR